MPEGAGEQERAVVREAGPDDAAGIGAVLVRSWRVAYRGLVPQEYLDGLDADERAAWWRAGIQNRPPGVRIMVAVRGGEIVGFAACGPPLEPHSPEGGALYSLYVDPDVWDVGVGSMLIGAVHGQLDGGWPTATLWVASGNGRARRFYERHGWLAEAVTRTEPIGGRPLDETRYRRTR